MAHEIKIGIIGKKIVAGYMIIIISISGILYIWTNEWCKLENLENQKSPNRQIPSRDARDVCANDRTFSFR